MSVESLLTKQWNNTRYDARPKSSLKCKSQGSAWGTDIAPEFLKSGKEEKCINKNIARRLSNSTFSSCYTSSIIKTVEPFCDCAENRMSYCSMVLRSLTQSLIYTISASLYSILI